MKPQGRLLLTIRDERGEVVATRAAKNRVLRGGAEVIAGLFAGTRDVPIDKVRLGFGQATIDPTSDKLTPPPTPDIPAAALEAPVAKEHFTVRPGDGQVTVDVAAPFTPSQNIDGVSEAGLVSGDVLYNQVIFEPVNLRTGQVVTFFWQIDFPFGQ
jgi:hypothetical protein